MQNKKWIANYKWILNCDGIAYKTHYVGYKYKNKYEVISHSKICEFFKDNKFKAKKQNKVLAFINYFYNIISNNMENNLGFFLYFASIYASMILMSVFIKYINRITSEAISIFLLIFLVFQIMGFQFYLYMKVQKYSNEKKQKKIINITMKIFFAILFIIFSTLYYIYSRRFIIKNIFLFSFFDSLYISWYFSKFFNYILLSSKKAKEINYFGFFGLMFTNIVSIVLAAIALFK